MQTLDNVVRETVQQFVKDGLLFTGLDVSNKVKETLPFARHSEVSELVRLSFASEFEPAGYAKSPINVTLSDGSTRTAMLYHSLADSWDLDTKYGDQKRSQTAVKPNAVKPVAVPATVTANGTVVVKPVSPAMPAPAAAPVVTQAQARDLWAGMFNSQPSLFPLK